MVIPPTLKQKAKEDNVPLSDPQLQYNVEKKETTEEESKNKAYITNISSPNVQKPNIDYPEPSSEAKQVNTKQQKPKGKDGTSSLGKLPNILSQGFAKQNKILSKISGTMESVGNIQRAMFLDYKRDRNKTREYKQSTALGGTNSESIQEILNKESTNTTYGGTGLADLAELAAGLFGAKKLKDIIFKKYQKGTSTSTKGTSTSTKGTSTSTKGTSNKGFLSKLGDVLKKIKLGGPVGKVIMAATAAYSYKNLMDLATSPSGKEQALGHPTSKVDISNIDTQDIGSISSYFESGNRGVGTISTGIGDKGGASYGKYQLASKTGTLTKYLKSSGYSKNFLGLQPGTKEFNEKWKQLAENDENFGKSQEEFIKQTHYLPQLQKLKNSGIDLSKKGKAVQSALFSTSVQFGANTNLVKNALKGMDVSKASDTDIVKAIQDYKIRNNETLFRSSSSKVRQSVLNRAKKEKEMLLALAEKTKENTDIQTVLKKTIVTPEKQEIKQPTVLGMVSDKEVKEVQDSIVSEKIPSMAETAAITTGVVGVGALGKKKIGEVVKNVKEYKQDVLSTKDILRQESKPPIVKSSKILGKAAGRAIPGLNVALGGAEAYSILTDNTKTDKEKKVALGETAGSTAGAAAGAVAGQILIPIPVVGALVGGAVGSYLGGITGKSLTEKITTKKEESRLTKKIQKAEDKVNNVKLSNKKDNIEDIKTIQNVSDTKSFNNVEYTNRKAISPYTSITKSEYKAKMLERKYVDTNRNVGFRSIDHTSGMDTTRAKYNPVKEVKVSKDSNVGINPKREDPIKRKKSLATNQLVNAQSVKPTLEHTPVMVNDIGVTLINIGHI